MYIMDFEKAGRQKMPLNMFKETAVANKGSQIIRIILAAS